MQIAVGMRQLSVSKFPRSSSTIYELYASHLSFYIKIGVEAWDTTHLPAGISSTLRKAPALSVHVPLSNPIDMPA